MSNSCATFTLHPGGIKFKLRDMTYQNNSLVVLEDIGERGDALFCITDFFNCCTPLYTSEMKSVLGNWFFPNETRVPSSGHNWDFHRTRGHMVVRLHRRRGGAEGIYRCEIPDAMNVIQTIYIGVYSASIYREHSHYLSKLTSGDICIITVLLHIHVVCSSNCLTINSMAEPGYFQFDFTVSDLIYHSRTLLNKKCMVYSSMENCERIQVQFWVLGPPHMHYYKEANSAMQYIHNFLKLPSS